MPKEAIKIVKKLKAAGFVAYYAGGWVRDYLLKHPSDDIDIATSASPDQIQQLFPRTIPVGSQFGIIIVQVGKKQYELATFRRDIEYKDGRRPSRVEFTDAIEDAQRRDFTINGMFYDPLEDQIHDFVGGKEDLKRGLIRAIGDAHLRINEDRLRMIRAIRLSKRFKFEIEEKTALAIKAHASELFPSVAIERICQELKKMSDFGTLKECLIEMHHFHLLETIFPDTKGSSSKELEIRLQPLAFYPKKSPLLTELICLFPPLKEPELIKLWKYLKLSNEEKEIALFILAAEDRLRGDLNDVELVHLYANPKWTVAANILKARCSPNEQTSFYKFHLRKRRELSHWIKRVVEQNPVVSAFLLKEEGIHPGKSMGLLLKEAEKIAIEERIKHPQEALAKLKEGPLWPKD